MNPDVRAVVLGLSFVSGTVIDAVAFARLGDLVGIVIAIIVVMGLAILAEQTDTPEARAAAGERRLARIKARKK